MENFSKTELQWIQAAVQSEQEKLKEYLSAYVENPAVSALIRLRIEGLDVAEQKLAKVISEGHRRISVS